MSDSDGENWLLGHEHSESERTRYLQPGQAAQDLDTGYLLHPGIIRVLQPESRIADLATGTGIWLRDIAKEVPLFSELHGFDISDQSFPDASVLPKNVKLLTHDVKRPFPDEHLGRYNAMNIRLLRLAMTRVEDWKIVTKNVVALLLRWPHSLMPDQQPGGHIQWAEANLYQLPTPLRTNPDTFTKALSYSGKTVFHILGNRGWLGNGYMERFSLFRTCGLVDVCEAASARFLSAQRQLIKSGLLD
ncbi:hypothetical protein BJ546DRAFT_1062304 [Cryomyces antarcticus]